MEFSVAQSGILLIPILLMGDTPAAADTTAELLSGREAIFLHHLWDMFTGDKVAAPFDEWEPYIQAMTRRGISKSSSAYYRQAYEPAAQIQELLRSAIAGEKSVGEGQAALVANFAANVAGNIVIGGSGHFLPEERPNEVLAALIDFLK